MRPGFQISAANRDGAGVCVCQPAEFDAPDRRLTAYAVDSQRGITAVVLGRIYYQRRADDFQSRSDAEIALAVFRDRGLEGLKSLEGEFSLAVVDAPNRTIHAMRDAIGNWPLYWTKSADSVFLGTNLRRLASLTGRTEADPDYIARFLMYPFGFGELATPNAAVRGISRVQPGTVATFRFDGTQREERYFDWDNRIPDLTGITLEEAAVEFRRLFQDAVRERVATGRVAAHMSGGMDSSSAALVADEVLGGRGLVTLSGVNRIASLAGERKYMELVLAGRPTMEPRFLNADKALDFDWFDRGLPEHDEPIPSLFRLAGERMLVDGAVKSGATTILTGSGADDILAENFNHLADLTRRGRWLKALREAARWAKAGNYSPWPLFWQFAVKPLVPAALRQGWGTFLRGGYGRWPKSSSFHIPPWVRRDFALRHALRRLSLQAVRESSRYPAQRSFSTYWLKTTAGDWSSWYLASPRGIRNSHPFLDPRVVTFCLGLPVDVRQQPGRQKPVLADALRDLLPEPIRTRRRKGNFNDVYWGGLAKQLPRLEQMVRRSKIDELGIFDKDSLLSAMRQHALGIGDAMVGSKINSSLSLIAWFDQIGSGRENMVVQDGDSSSRSGVLTTLN